MCIDSYLGHNWHCSECAFGRIARSRLNNDCGYGSCIGSKLSLNPLDAVTTVPSQIVAILMEDQEFVLAKTLAAFMRALGSIIITLFLNFLPVRS